MLLLLAFPLLANATHIVGGEIYYTYLGNNVYQITLTVYRDCSSNNTQGTGFDQDASVGIFNASGSLYTNITMTLNNATTSNLSVGLENPCFVLPPNVCVDRAVYTTNVTLPPSADGYTISYQRCCSNGTVANLVNPSSTGITLTTTIPGTSTGAWGNSSPYFTTTPSVAMCLGADYFFNTGVLDPDGDELQYTFCEPYTGGTPTDPAPAIPSQPPYTPVTFANGFDANNPMPGNPPFSIDPVTGFITGNASQLGMFVVCICVSDVRNGVVLSTTRRTFQFKVTNCDPNITAAVSDQSTFCSGLTYNFTNNSINSTTYHWNFDVPGTAADTSNVRNPSFTFPAQGTYNVMMVANPYWPCADTTYTEYNVYLPVTPTITLGQYECISDDDTYGFFGSGGTNAAAQYAWSFGAGSVPLTSNLQNPSQIRLNEENALNTVSLTLTNNGCTASSSFDVVNPPDPTAVADPQTEFCQGYTYSFTQSSINATDFYWDFGTSSEGDNSAEPSPTYNFGVAGNYLVMLVAMADNTCPDTTYSNLFLSPLLAPVFEDQTSQCLSTNSFDFTANGYSSANPLINWTLEGPASVTTSTAASLQDVQWSNAGTYTVSLTIEENGCVETYSNEVWVANDPTISFAADVLEGCPGQTVGFDATVTADTPVGIVWDFGDGSSGSALDLFHTYSNPGIYDVSVTAFATSGCIASVTASRPQYINIYPLPTPGFEVSSGTVDILSPTMTINSTANADNCSYALSDGSMSNTCDFVHEWSASGPQTITQAVTNDFGCTATLIKTVNVGGVLFYLPNAFTPDGDGVNDFWQCVSTGISTFKLKLYNRWGALVWETHDPQFKWLGNTWNGDHFVPDDVYFWTVEFEDLLEQSFEFKGNVAVVR